MMSTERERRRKRRKRRRKLFLAVTKGLILFAVIMVIKLGASMIKKADSEPPLIDGVQELTVTAGGSISYKKGITVTDNRDTEVMLEVDSSNVNLKAAGDYHVIYRAVDQAGNVTELETIVHVEEAEEASVEEEYINEIADEILAQIIDEGMSQYDKAEAIYYWVHNNIAYADGTPKVSYADAAYRGLVNRKGDCYTYAMTAKCLLTRAGIKNMDIEKIPAETHHYWNLIDLGDGWYHFDATRRKDGTIFFYWTDAQLMEYSNSHNKSHNYDPAQYPKIQ